MNPSSNGCSYRNLVDIFMGISEVVIKRQGIVSSLLVLYRTNNNYNVYEVGRGRGRDTFVLLIGKRAQQFECAVRSAVPSLRIPRKSVHLAVN